MILISEREAEFLRNNRRGHDIHIASITHKGKHKSYYLTTSPKSMALLDKYRKEKIISTRDGQVK